MATRPISQGPFVGLDASAQPFAQPRGTVPRLSNLYPAQTGALRTIEGTGNLLWQGSPWSYGNYGAFLDVLVLTIGTLPAWAALYAVADSSMYQTLLLYRTGYGAYNNADVVATFPLSSLRRNGYSYIYTSGKSVNGGLLGEASIKSQLLQFRDRLIVLLGNGVSPQEYTPGTGASALANNFSGSLPKWQASTPYWVGSHVVPTTANGHMYACIQQGATGSTEPTWPTASGATVADGSLIWQEAGASAIVPPRGAAHAIIHAGFLWLWNTQPTTTSDLLDGPSCLKMSDLNNPDSWNPLNTTFVDRDDGTEGMGMASFAISATGIAPENILVLFKNYSTYVVRGVFGSSDFQIVRAKTDMGCIAPRTIRFIAGLGIVRLTHRGTAVFDGIDDVLIGPEVRPYLWGLRETSDVLPVDAEYIPYGHATLTEDPALYCLSVPVATPACQGEQTRVVLWNRATKGWAVVDLPFGVLGMAQVHNPGYRPITALLGFNDGMTRRWRYGGIHEEKWDGTTPIPWSLRTPEVSLGSATDRSYFRRVLIRGALVVPPYLSLPQLSPVDITATVTVNGTGQPQVKSKQFTLGAGQFELEIPVGLTGLSADLELSGAGPVEFQSVEWHGVPKPAGVPASLMR